MTALPNRHFPELESAMNEGLLRDRPRWMRRVGLLNDFVRVPHANGSSFASQFLFRELSARGHEVFVVGPRDPDAKPADLPPNHVSVRSVPLRNHPGVHLAMPS